MLSECPPGNGLSVRQAQQFGISGLQTEPEPKVYLESPG
jgi:hypothetical protein